MTDIALFHSVLGVRPGIRDAAERLRAEGHKVVVVDQYDGRVFDDYDEAGEFAQSIGYPTLMGLAEEAVHGLPTDSSPPDSPTAAAWRSSLPPGDPSVVS